jgi:hypothetical protein
LRHARSDSAAVSARNDRQQRIARNTAAGP